MDTRAAAEMVGTDSKTLRRFIRTPGSTFTAVGSGSRYEFQTSDIPVLRRLFSAWLVEQTPRRTTPPKSRQPVIKRPKLTRTERDRIVWEEEGDVVMPDIRDPRVRAEVRHAGQLRAQRLDEMLLACGLHISQHRDRVG